MFTATMDEVAERLLLGPTMRVGRPRIERSQGVTRCAATFEYAGGSGELRFDVRGDAGHLACDASDPFLIALLPMAMVRGENVTVDGPVSERLLYHLTQHFQAIAASVIPARSRVAIHAPVIDDAEPAARGVATGFSGGVDSLCVLLDHHFEPERAGVPPGYRITHLLFNNVGSIASGPKRLEQMQSFADHLCLPLISIDSNIHELYRKEPLGFLRTHVLRNVAAAMVLQGGIGVFLYGSSHPYSRVRGGRAESIGYSEPITVPLLSTERFDAVSSGCPYTRVEKTVRISTLPFAHHALNVCVDLKDGVRNCSRCFKCLRTMLTLEIAGALEPFAPVFDFSIYARERTRYMGEVLAKGDVFAVEVVEFAQRTGFRFPKAAFVRHRMRAVQQSKRKLRAIASGIANRLRGHRNARPATMGG